jgi:Protein of unknown function (DUF3309)
MGAARPDRFQCFFRERFRIRWKTDRHWKDGTGKMGQTCGSLALDGEQSHVSTKEKRMLLLIVLIVLIFGFGYGGYRVGPGWGYYGGGGVSLILTIVLILLLLRVI